MRREGPAYGCKQVPHSLLPPFLGSTGSPRASPSKPHPFRYGLALQALALCYSDPVRDLTAIVITRGLGNPQADNWCLSASHREARARHTACPASEAFVSLENHDYSSLMESETATSIHTLGGCFQEPGNTIVYHLVCNRLVFKVRGNKHSGKTFYLMSCLKSCNHQLTLLCGQ